MATSNHDVSEERLDRLEEGIQAARRQAQEHGTLPSDEPEQTFIDPDADGRVDDGDEDPGATLGA
jgi:hypothetical protein